MNDNIDDIQKRICELNDKRHRAIEKLVEPARAAANQMKDAKMAAGAEPLLIVLFEIDSLTEELTKIYTSNPHQALAALFGLLKR